MLPSSTASEKPPTLVLTTARPAAIASRQVVEKPSLVPRIDEDVGIAIVLVDPGVRHRTP